MKKTLSTHSLLSSRRGSLQKVSQQSKQIVDKQQQKPIPKHRLPSPIVKNIKLDTFKQESKAQIKKNDIKQIYEYKIKQRAQKTKISQKSKHQDLSSTYHHQTSTNIQDKRLIESLKLQNEKMSKQLSDLAQQNKHLAQLLKQSLETKNSDSKKDKQKAINQKDYKKTILNKLNDRQRIKTQMTASFTKLNNHQLQQQNLHQKQKTSKPKNANSKNKQTRQGSRNSITMNLNMSFVKIKSPSTSKNSDLRESSKQFMSKMVKSTSGKNLNFKQQGSKSTSKFNSHEQNTDIRSLFKSYLEKKSINSKDLSQFYQLNKKIFSEFSSLISFSRQVYAQILNKIDLSQCYDSKKMQESKYYKNQKNMKETLRMIQELYKMNSLQNSKRDYGSPQISEKKYHVSEIQHDQNPDTPESSVISFAQVHHNIERQKSYEKYRLKKLNQNLDLFANKQSKKLKTQATQPQTTESKVYFSKPISTNVSRKISFNNSYNNSLKNSKIE